MSIGAVQMQSLPLSGASADEEIGHRPTILRPFSSLSPLYGRNNRSIRSPSVEAEPRTQLRPPTSAETGLARGGARPKTSWIVRSPISLLPGPRA